MKFVIIGLGNFGVSLGEQLIKSDHEVFGIDIRMDKVEATVELFTHVLCADTTEEVNIKKIPLDDADYIIICIGSNMGAALATTALVKKNTKKEILCRAANSIHGTILKSMNVDQILYPEIEYAEGLASRLTQKGVLRAMSFDANHEVVEIKVPTTMVGRTLREIKLRSKWKINLVTVIRDNEKKHFFGKKSKKRAPLGVISPDFVFLAGDNLVLYGSRSDLKLFNS